MNFVKIAAAALTLALGATAALAQGTAPAAPKAPVVATTPAPTTAAPTAMPSATKSTKLRGAAANKARTAESLACSKEADSQNIHGKKLRPAFMKKCKAEKMAAAKKS